MHPYTHWGFPRWLNYKESASNAGDTGLIPGQKDHLEEEMATYSSILAWEIPSTEEGYWWATVYGVTESDRTESDMTKLDTTED